MGKDWDGTGVAFDSGTWIAVMRVLKPGGHILAFGGTRTFHRLTCAIEDAGFEIRDCLSWLYGSGFPKSHNIGNGRGTALKPAWEPIVLARKPLIGTVAKNVERFRTGAINVDGCRIETSDVLSWGSREIGDGIKYGTIAKERQTPGEQHALGRWPANLVLDEDAAAMLDAEVGTLKSGRLDRSQITAANKTYGKAPKERKGIYETDTGGPSRFFYCAKASRAERNAGLEGMPNGHPTIKPLALMRWLVRLVTPPGGTVLDPFTGSGTTGVACVNEGFDFVGIEQDAEYVEIARRRIEHAQGAIFAAVEVL